jgi:hypothetical protein
MENLTAAFNSLFKDINSSWGAYLLAVAGLGTLTMAFLQVIKETTPLRAWFHRWEMTRWLAAQAIIVSDSLKSSVYEREAEKELLLLATDGDESAFYGLELEKLCGQWNAGLRIVMDFPEMYTSLFYCTAARARSQDLKALIEQKLPEALPPHEEVTLDEGKQRHRMVVRKNFVDARNRVTHQMQRAVDSFQITTAFRWKWSLQMASFAISFVFAYLAVKVYGQGASGVTLWSALIAGFIAPVARDLLAALQKLRA